ncbi:interleukin-12 subunit alpha [Suncus etruscus]|uniref:interleukin-12 subunit alpha n=1 Tax=Suncus etruscus TaxID=109475 RepID=UPI002110973D|nr:interleukin-12 subunit alpha [Suncus etruscus]
MHPLSLLHLSATLVLLSLPDHITLAKSLPTTLKGSLGVSQRLSRSQSLLRAVSASLHTAKQTLVHYPCSPEEIDHIDITREKTHTAKDCLPLEPALNGSCLPSPAKDPSIMQDLCLQSIYKDLELYQLEFRTLNAKLLMDPQQQISLDQNLLSSIEELMKTLFLNKESKPHLPAMEEPDFYRTKVQLCTLLQAFRVRAVTIDRMMSYLSA